MATTSIPSTSSLLEIITEIDDVKKLKSRRAARKGNISKQDNHIQTLVSTTLDKIDSTDLQYRAQQVEFNISVFDMLQERIEDIAEQSALVADQANVDEQRRTNELTRVAYANKIRVHNAWKLGMGLKNDIEDLLESRKVTGTRACQSFKDITSLYKEFCAETISFTDETVVKKLRDEIKAMYRTLSNRVDDEIEKEEADRLLARESSSSTLTTTNTTTVVNSSKLKLNLPTFSGNILQWWDFWRLFSDIIDKETSLSDSEKICHLVSSMKGTEVQELAQRVAARSGSYDDVVKALQDRYGRQRTVYQHHVQELLAKRKYEYNRSDLQELLDHFKARQLGFIRNGGPTIDQLMVAIYEEFLGEETLKEWHIYSAKTKGPAKADEFIQFVEERVNAFPMSKKIMSKPSHRESKAFVMQAKSSIDSSCPACNGAQHPLYLCSTFKSWDQERRFRFIKKAKHCTNCLGKGHLMQQCPSNRSCKTCYQKHHSLLHKSDSHTTDPTPPQANANTGTQNAQALCSSGQIKRTTALLNTAVVTVVSGRSQTTSRAVLDTGATMSLVTSRLANLLKAKREPSPLSISGIGGDLHSNHTVCLNLYSTHDSSRSLHVRAHVVESIVPDVPAQNLHCLTSQPFLQDKELADPYIGSSRRIDILLGVAHTNLALLEGRATSTSDPSIIAQETIFGWVVAGEMAERSTSGLILRTVVSDAGLDKQLQNFWQTEEVHGDSSPLTQDQLLAVEHFHDNTYRDSSGRYVVSLPWRPLVVELGESRSTALRRYLSNEKSLKRKGNWDAFAEVVQEYGKLGHAELVPPEELNKPSSSCYYLPMHGVTKEESTTTKLRVVFDASAKTTSGVSLNDQLLPGPSLYPMLTTVLNKFRLHPIAMSADISKMFREVGLNKTDRDYHRFLFRASSGDLEEWRMTRLTFGVTSSPFLASSVLRQVAEDYKEEYPLAAEIIHSTFYVDDCLTGASTLSEAFSIRTELNTLLSKSGMTLRKWRSNSKELLASIPESLCESSDLHISSDCSSCAKILGISWDTVADSFRVIVPQLEDDLNPTKRQVTSAVARFYDILGWFSPVTLLMKILIQKLWQEKIGWDDTIPSQLAKDWHAWRNELSLLSSVAIPRRLMPKNHSVQDYQLHGFADASTLAYGGVIYLRTLYSDASVTVAIVTSKTKVAPLKKLTVPKLELCAALLLATLLHATAENLSISMDKIFAWSDSAVVLGWLQKSSSKLKVFVANRISAIQKLIPPSQWRYVSTTDNPADLASRGLSPKNLLDSTLWWNGPAWLSLPPDHWPLRVEIGRRVELPEVRATVLSTTIVEEFKLWKKYSSFDRLLRVVAWCFRFAANARGRERKHTETLSCLEMESARTLLLGISQKMSYPSELDTLSKGKVLPITSSLFPLHPLLGKDGLIRVGGRLQRSDLQSSSIHPIVLDRHSNIVVLLVSQVHRDAHHAGPSTMMALLAENYFISGIKKLCKSISRNCVVCQKAYMKTATQMMGQLPPARTNPTPPFQSTGIDFAGPLLCRLGKERKPIKVKSYACLFICMSTKAVHIELVSELTTEAFLAAFTRFTARRGFPSDVYSDNGLNFVGANRELAEAFKLISAEATRLKLNHITSHQQTTWHFIPKRAPHFGGLWESGVKHMKRLLQKNVGTHLLTFEQLTTILSEAEATLNSRPLVTLDSTSPDGVTALTPGHFLIGRPLLAPPLKVDQRRKLPLLRKWNLVRRLISELWVRWRKEYLQSLQAHNKWKQASRNFKVGDVVLIKDDTLVRRSWPLALVLKIYPGQDGYVRVVDLRCNDGHCYKRTVHRLVLLVPSESTDPDLRPVENVQVPEEES